MCHEAGSYFTPTYLFCDDHVHTVLASQRKTAFLQDFVFTPLHTHTRTHTHTHTHTIMTSCFLVCFFSHPVGSNTCSFKKRDTVALWLIYYHNILIIRWYFFPQIWFLCHTVHGASSVNKIWHTYFSEEWQWLFWNQISHHIRLKQTAYSGKLITDNNSSQSTKDTINPRP